MSQRSRPRTLRVVATDTQGWSAENTIRVSMGGDRPARKRAERGQDKALVPWAGRGLLGTRLGPNKNGSHW